MLELGRSCDTPMQQTRLCLQCHQVQEVGDGNINFVYIVEGPHGALVVKQGLPYIRIAPDWPLTQVSLKESSFPLSLFSSCDPRLQYCTSRLRMQNLRSRSRHSTSILSASGRQEGWQVDRGLQ